MGNLLLEFNLSLEIYILLRAFEYMHIQYKLFEEIYQDSVQPYANKI